MPDEKPIQYRYYRHFLVHVLFRRNEPNETYFLCLCLRVNLDSPTPGLTPVTWTWIIGRVTIGLRAIRWAEKFDMLFTIRVA